MSTLPQRFPPKRISSRRLARLAADAVRAHEDRAVPAEHASPAGPVTARVWGMSVLEVAALAAMLLIGALLLARIWPDAPPKAAHLEPKTEEAEGPEATHKLALAEEGGGPPEPKPEVEPSPVKPAPREDAWIEFLIAQKAGKVSFEFVDTPLDEALAFLSKKTGTKLALDREIPNNEIPTISLKVSEMGLTLALEWIGKLGGVRFEVQDDRVVCYSPAIRAQPVQEKVYEVGDLLSEHRSAEQWAALVKDVVGKGTWSEGRIFKVDGKRLIVKHRTSVLARIEKVLEGYRASAALPKDKKEALREKLRGKISFEFSDTAIEAALQEIAKLIQVEIEFEKGLDDRVRKSAITLKVADMQADLALDWALKLAGLDYVLGESGIEVRKPEEVELRIYDVSDLAPSGEKLAEVARLVPERVMPESWSAERGRSIDVRAGRLVVMQAPRVHKVIEMLLSELRKAKAQAQTSSPPAGELGEAFQVHKLDGKLIDSLLEKLGSKSFDDRERAEKDLRAMGHAEVEVLEAHLKASDDMEVRTRLDRIVRDLKAESAYKAVLAKGGPFVLRASSESRLKAAERYGGGRETEAAVDKGLEWLARHQEADGHFDCVKYGGKQADVGVTGLALLAYLGAGHSEAAGKYKENVRRAVAWLRGIQRDDGSLFQEGETHGIGYHHGIAGLALLEAAGIGRTEDTVKAAQRALDYSVNKHMSEIGGWRYAPGQQGDLVVSGWYVQQLKAAKLAGMKVPAQAFEKTISFLDRCRAPGDEHRYGYMDGTSVAFRRTASGCLARMLLGTKKEELTSGVAWSVRSGGEPEWGPNGGSVDLYYWYYGTQAAFHHGGEIWNGWNAALRKSLGDNQRLGGDEDGSWDPVGAYASYWGRVGQTAMGVLCLQVYYRYPRVYGEGE